MNNPIDQHCSEIERCNQRGGRMLSIVDLLDAGTFSPELAAYSLAAIRGGASFMVGAVPGGAGKTTVMGALLNFVPPDVLLAAADRLKTIEDGIATPQPRHCYICHEIGNGPYYSYLWNSDLRRFFDLPLSDHMIATNLHADTYEQARQQVCSDNPVSPVAFRRMNLLYFLSVEFSGLERQRRIVSVWESDGLQEHRQIFSATQPDIILEDSSLVTPASFSAAQEDLARFASSSARTIQEVRSALVERR